MREERSQNWKTIGRGASPPLTRDTRLDILTDDPFFFSRGTESRTKGRDERTVKMTSGQTTVCKPPLYIINRPRCVYLSACRLCDSSMIVKSEYKALLLLEKHETNTQNIRGFSVSVLLLLLYLRNIFN